MGVPGDTRLHLAHPLIRCALPAPPHRCGACVRLIMLVDKRSAVRPFGYPREHAVPTEGCAGARGRRVIAPP